MCYSLTSVADAHSTGAIILHAGGAQTSEAVPVDGALPAQELINRQFITVASFLKAEQATANGGNHFGFAADHPALSFPWWQVSHCQRAPIGANHITDAYSVLLFGHFTQLPVWNHAQITCSS
jgi:hypothetical protein